MAATSGETRGFESSTRGFAATNARTPTKKPCATRASGWPRRESNFMMAGSYAPARLEGSGKNRKSGDSCVTVPTIRYETWPGVRR